MWRVGSALGILMVLATPASASNYLVVILDDVGVDKISGYEDMYGGGPSPTYVPDTPVLDDLMTHGLRFTNAWANPTCSPSRATLQTGRMPYQTGVGWTAKDDQGVDVRMSDVTLAEALPGFTSGLFGKWGLGTSTHPKLDLARPGAQPSAPNAALQGYSEYVGFDESWDNYDDWTEVDWPVDVHGVAMTEVSESTTYVDDELFDRAADFIEAQTGPWLAVVALKSAHADGDGPTWETDDLPSTKSCGSCSQAEIFQALVENSDANLGVFLDNLYASDPTILEDTYILVLGDNGSPYELLEGVFRTTTGGGGKSTVYESGVRVPFVWVDGCDWTLAQPGSTSTCTPTISSVGRDVDAPITFADLMPTLTDLEGSPQFTEWGMSFAGCLGDPSSDCGFPALANRVRMTEIFQRSAGVRKGPAKTGDIALRQGDYKLVAHQVTSHGHSCLDHEFYDLAGDPFEATDLYAGSGVVVSGQAEYDALATALAALPTSDTSGWVPKQTCR